MERKDIEVKFKEFGVKVFGLVFKKIEYLMVGEKVGLKKVKVENFNVLIMNED